MRALVVGATSVFGRTLLEALGDAGHEVIGMTRSSRKTDRIERLGASAVIADVLDREGLSLAIERIEPEAVISLLVTLPKNGPLRASQVHPNLPLWGEGVPNLVSAAKAAGARRLLAESFVFAYGYEQYGPEPLTESTKLVGGPVIPGQAEILRGLRDMEQCMTNAGGIVLRYGGRHGAEVPMTVTLSKGLRLGVPMLPGGGHALLPFIEAGDAARATIAALERGVDGEVYNVVDDRPSEVHEYASALSNALGCPKPRAVPLCLARQLAPYMTCVLNDTRLPVSNLKAKCALSWKPRYPTIYDAIDGYIP